MLVEKQLALWLENKTQRLTYLILGGNKADNLDLQNISPLEGEKPLDSRIAVSWMAQAKSGLSQRPIKWWHGY